MHTFPIRSLAATALGAAFFLACSETAPPTAESAATPAPGTADALASPTLTPQQSGTTNRLQAISPVNDNVAWASGTGGTFTLTTDGGKHWHAGVVPGADALEFRDVEGVSATEAYLLSAGTGTDARVYKTIDGGKHWKLQFQNHNAAAFYDCFAFWTPTRGLAMADGVNGRFPVIRTEDGQHWDRIPQNLPAAQPGEAAFAASGTCVATFGRNLAWIATGGAEHARILRTADGGDTWKAFATPIVQGTPVSGIFTVAFRDNDHGILAGGDLDHPDQRSANVAVSSDGGRTWQLATRTPFDGAAFGLSYVPSGNSGPAARTVVITGPGGAAWSGNEGAVWHRLPGVENFWATAFASRSRGWLVGTDGRILEVEFPELGS
jgi:photosystem II stability/assembly factor-like uncharacterized protein